MSIFSLQDVEHATWDAIVQLGRRGEETTIWIGMGWVSVLSSVVEERVKSEGEGKAMLSLIRHLNSRNGTLTKALTHLFLFMQWV